MFSLSAVAAPEHIDVKSIAATIEQVGGVEAYLRIFATEYGKELPRMLDSSTELTSSYSQGRTLGINERITDLKTNRVLFSVDKATLKARFEANALPNVCNIPINRFMIETYDVTYAYSIHSMDGHFILTYQASSETCARWFKWRKPGASYH